MSSFINKIPEGLLESELGCGYSMVHSGLKNNFFKINGCSYNVAFSDEALMEDFGIAEFILIMKETAFCFNKLENGMVYEFDDEDIRIDYYVNTNSEHSMGVCRGVAYIYSKKYRGSCRDLESDDDYHLRYSELYKDMNISCEL